MAIWKYAFFFSNQEKPPVRPSIVNLSVFKGPHPDTIDGRQKLPVSGSISTNPVFLQQIWNLARGLYSGGSAQMVENSLGIHGDEILYVGDHIYTHKAALYKCNIAGNPAVVTRLVESMTDNLRATRAEATDVGNAVLDG
ncbi:hypothetical protein L2E82_23046 [Cichorium intybus]|uniref:Uncharacterized protein n=1 Tax=Cichorium intybus TaxID=13427 RepID=A0ACB9DZG3_CICIN|nr:hypothetical protein L2E82_23046 [Cichorium intybus]